MKIRDRIAAFFSRFSRPQGPVISNSSARNPMQWFIDWVRDGSGSDSGVSVNGRTCLTYAAVWQATNIIAGDVGQMPLNVWRSGDNGRQDAVGHKARRLLSRRPNYAMNVGVFKETLQSHALLWGNGRAGIVRDAYGAPEASVPFLPDRSYSKVIDGKLWHFTKIGDDNTYTPFADEHVLHIKGLGFDGTEGYSVITLARNSWGMGLAQEKFGSSLLKNNARPSVVLSTPGVVLREDALRILQDWEKMHAGADNAGRTALLDKGLTATPLAISPTDAQWLESRRFSRQEVASWFNLPPHKLGDSEGVAYNGLEQQNASYLQHTLMRWINTWEEECDEKLLTEREKNSGRVYCQFDTSSLLRGDQLSRYRVYQIGIASTILSPNEAREAEGLNPREGGDEYANPNTRAAGQEKSEDDGDAVPKAMRREQIAARLEELIAVECQRVTAAAAKPKTFCTWLEGFYGDSRWPATLARVLQSLGGGYSPLSDAKLAVEHCEQSRCDLLEAAGRATPEKLASEVARVIAAWPLRAYDLADAIGD
jgi:HK97 family phage portal protein